MRDTRLRPESTTLLEQFGKAAVVGPRPKPGPGHAGALGAWRPCVILLVTRKKSRFQAGTGVAAMGEGRPPTACVGPGARSPPCHHGLVAVPDGRRTWRSLPLHIFSPPHTSSSFYLNFGEGSAPSRTGFTACSGDFRAGHAQSLAAPRASSHLHARCPRPTWAVCPAEPCRRGACQPAGPLLCLPGRPLVLHTSVARCAGLNQDCHTPVPRLWTLGEREHAFVPSACSVVSGASLVTLSHQVCAETWVLLEGGSRFQRGLGGMGAVCNLSPVGLFLPRFDSRWTLSGPRGAHPQLSSQLWVWLPQTGPARSVAESLGRQGL